MGQFEPQPSTYLTVETGPSCSLNSKEGQNSFFDLARIRAKAVQDSILMYEQGNVPNHHMESTASGLDWETIKEAFEACPCKDPANIGKQVGRAGCLALLKLRET